MRFAIAKVILIFYCVPAMSQYTIAVDTIRVDNSKIAHVSVHISNASANDFYVHEDELMSEYIFFSEKEIIEPVAKVLFMKDPPKTEKERLHIIKKGESITLPLTISLGGYELDKQKSYKIIWRYNTYRKKKFNNALPLPGPRYTNPASVLFAN